MGKQYRTANGKSVDIETLILNNELAPAIGNMNVNARGDKINSNGDIIKSRSEVMADYHKLHTTVPQDGEVKNSSELTPDNIGDQNAD